MVIDPNNGLNSVSSGTARSRNSAGISTDTSTAGASKGASTSKSDHVILSGEAQALQRLEAKINGSPEIDSARVAKIKEAIANGSFEINADRIAERMLNSDDLLG